MKKIESAKARGEAPPDEPGMQQILAELKNASAVSELPTNEHHVGLPASETVVGNHICCGAQVVQPDMIQALCQALQISVSLGTCI